MTERHEKDKNIITTSLNSGQIKLHISVCCYLSRLLGRPPNGHLCLRWRGGGGRRLQFQREVPVKSRPVGVDKTDFPPATMACVRRRTTSPMPAARGRAGQAADHGGFPDVAPSDSLRTTLGITTCVTKILKQRTPNPLADTPERGAPKT